MNKILVILIIICSLEYSHAQWVNVGNLPGNWGNYPSVSVVDNNVAWFAGGLIIWRTTNGGASYFPLQNPNGPDITCLHAVSANECFVGDGGSFGAGGGNAKLYRTTNGGVNWVIVNQTGGTAGFFLDIVFSKVSPQDGIAVSNSPNGTGQPFFLLKTIDGGNNWTVENPPGVAASNGVWHCGIIYDASAYGFGLTGGIFPRVRGTTDAGTTWSTFPVLISGNPISSFAYSDVSAIALAGTSAVVARTTDQGLTWQTVNTGGALCIRWISGTNIAYFLSSGIVKKSTDDGATWNSMTIPSVSNLKHFDFAVAGTNVYGYAITATGDIIKLTENITSVNIISENIPNHFKLYNNYPNPFNPSTKIKFDIPGGLPNKGLQPLVQITVYDISGSEVATLVNEQLNPGTYEVTFDASKYSSGVYFYKLTAGDYTDSKKMMLVK